MSPEALALEPAWGAPAQTAETLRPWTEASRELRLVRYLVFCAAHVWLGLLLRTNADLATIHGYVTVGLGITGVLIGAGAAWTACVAGYIAGTDVFWRMTQADTLHQSGKYAIALILLLWMVRNRRLVLSASPLVYFALLLPSTALVVEAGGINGHLRRPISFNLSGPLALTIAVLFFRQAALTRRQLLQVIGAVAVPIFAVLTLALHSTFTAKSIKFGGSNFVTSGGYGPNQVSSILGLGFLMLLVLALLTRTRGVLGTVLLGASVVLGMQCALTFSRGGLYSAGAGLLAALPFLARAPGARRRLVLGTIGLVAVVLLFVLPWLQEFTQGAFLKRIQDTSVTGRDRLMARDLSLWSSNALLGVGPGMSKMNIVEGGVGLAHTEFTRLIAEHGALGALAVAALLWIVIQSVRAAPAGVPRALAACFSAWALMYMLHAAMRLAAPSFMIGLGAGLASLADGGGSEPHGEHVEVSAPPIPHPLDVGGALVPG